jgi:adenylate kinase
MTQERRIPNIVITGTPGTGKSSHAQLLLENSSVPLQHINVGELVKEKKLYESYDSEWESYIVDDDKASGRTAWYRRVG